MSPISRIDFTPAETTATTPGHYHRLIHRVHTAVIALVPPLQGVRATLTSVGPSRVVVGPDVFTVKEILRPPETVTLTGLGSNTLVALEEAQARDLLYPFEGMGVDALWEFRMPQPANLFDYSTIADVRITIEYTALNSPNYYSHVVRALNQTRLAQARLHRGR